MHNGHSGDAAKFVAEGCGLGHDNVSVLIAVAYEPLDKSIYVFTQKRRGHTNDVCETIVPRYCFSVVTFPPLKVFRNINSLLEGFSLDIEFVYTALGDHCKTALPCRR